MNISEIDLTTITLGPKELLVVTLKNDYISMSVVEAFRSQFRAKMEEVFGPGSSKQVIIVALDNDSSVELTKVTQESKGE